MPTRVLIDVPAAAQNLWIHRSEAGRAICARLFPRPLPWESALLKDFPPEMNLTTWRNAWPQETGTRILIVTSDFHTRRSLSIFRHEMPGKSFSVAAARDETQFGARWWTHRQWAKTCLDEWLRLFWWNAVDRWR